MREFTLCNTHTHTPHHFGKGYQKGSRFVVYEVLVSNKPGSIKTLNF